MNFYQHPYRITQMAAFGLRAFFVRVRFTLADDIQACIEKTWTKFTNTVITLKQEETVRIVFCSQLFKLAYLVQFTQGMCKLNHLKINYKTLLT